VAESVRAVERALDILLCFSQDGPALSLTHIAEQAGIHKSTVHRLLATLESRRFVCRDRATGMYRLGFRFIEMASLVLQDVDLRRWARPYLQQLGAECGETIDLAVLDGAHVIYLDVVESPQRVKIAAAVGQRLPASCTASGKAFMAYLPDDEVRNILDKGLTKHTEHTLLSVGDLHEDLRRTRERGFAISEQEFEDDIHAIAAPILDANRYPVAAIAIVGPSFRLPHERMLTLGQSIRSTTDAIAHDVGLTALSAIISTTATSAITGQAN
jgi:IclR family transcriptional regulator, KDG regulon repressor